MDVDNTETTSVNTTTTNVVTVDHYQTILYDPKSLFQTAIAAAAFSANLVTDPADMTLTPVLVLFKSEDSYEKYLKTGYQTIRVFVDAENDNLPTSHHQVIYFDRNGLYDNIKLMPGLSAYYLMETVLCSSADYKTSTDITYDYAENFLYYVANIVKDPLLFFAQISTAYNGYDLISRYSHTGAGVKLGIELAEKTINAP